MKAKKIVSLCLCLLLVIGIATFGVLAAIQTGFKITGNINYQPNNCFFYSTVNIYRVSCETEIENLTISNVLGQIDGTNTSREILVEDMKIDHKQKTIKEIDRNKEVNDIMFDKEHNMIIYKIEIQNYTEIADVVVTVNIGDESLHVNQFKQGLFIENESSDSTSFTLTRKSEHKDPYGDGVRTFYVVYKQVQKNAGFSFDNSIGIEFNEAQQ